MTDSLQQQLLTATATVAAAAPFFAAASLLLSGLHLGRHLSNFALPVQLYTCRILLMVPVMAACSWLSLVYPTAAPALSAAIGGYEAFTLWTFVQLLLSYLGGEASHGEWLELRRPLRLPWPWGRCLRRVPLGPRFLRLVRQGALQFVVVKPVAEAMALLLDHVGLYDKGSFSLKRGYVYLSLCTNTSISVALYSLLLFYLASRSRLLPFHPVPKVLSVKLVVFVMYWQGCALMGLVWLRLLPRPSDAARLQHALVCCEMLGASVLHCFAFPVSEFADHEERQAQPLLSGLKRVLDVNDTLEEGVDLVAGRQRGSRGRREEREMEDQPANALSALNADVRWEPELAE